MWKVQKEARRLIGLEDMGGQSFEKLKFDRKIVSCFCSRSFLTLTAKEGFFWKQIVWRIQICNQILHKVFAKTWELLKAAWGFFHTISGCLLAYLFLL